MTYTISEIYDFINFVSIDDGSEDFEVRKNKKTETHEIYIICVTEEDLY